MKKKKGIFLIKLSLSFILFFFLTGFLLTIQTSAKKVTLISEGTIRNLITRENKVYKLLEEQNINIKKNNIVKPDLNEDIYDGIEIKIIKTKEEILDVKEPIKAKIKLIKTKRLYKDEYIELKPKEDGILNKKIKVLYHDENPVFKKVIFAKILKYPKKGERIVGINKEKRMYMMKKPMKVKKTLIMKATGYSTGPEDNGKWPGISYLNYKLGYGICAVDPKVIPLRTKVYIEGYGYAIAADIGSAIKRKKIDLCFDAYKEAQKYGVKWVKVHILEYTK